MPHIKAKALQARLDYQQRIGKAVSIAEVARATGLSRAAISAIERGTKQPSLDTVARLCKFYGVSVEAMLEYEDLLALQAAGVGT